MKNILLPLLSSIAFLSFQQRESIDLKTLYTEIQSNHLTMITEERFKTIDIIRQIGIPEGDIAEFGCWRGGMCIYLAYSFPERKIWVGDSFQGFETIDHCKYDPTGIVDERHSNGIWVVSEEEVRNNFLKFALDESKGIKFLPGWVNDTTDPATCPIEKLAILRIDVDAYSATLVTLENLYDKVVPGGFIIFDDSGLYECAAAIREFERKRGIEIVSKLHDPLGNYVGKLNGEHGLLMRK